jgi:hypothetical protein
MAAGPGIAGGAIAVGIAGGAIAVGIAGGAIGAGIAAGGAGMGAAALCAGTAPGGGSWARAVVDAAGGCNGMGAGIAMPGGGRTGPLLSGAPCEPGAGPLSGGARPGTP